MTIEEQCIQLSRNNGEIVEKILHARGYTSFRDIPNFDELILNTELAYQIASKAHMGAIDKGGRPYIEHPVAVASQFSCTYRKCAGYLHDVVEDTFYTLQDLQKAGIHPRVVRAVKALTHPKGYSYEAYIHTVALDPIAVDVKLADLLHNSTVNRLNTFDMETLDRMKRYNAALKFLAVNTFGLYDI